MDYHHFNQNETHVSWQERETPGSVPTSMSYDHESMNTVANLFKLESDMSDLNIKSSVIFYQCAVVNDNFDSSKI